MILNDASIESMCSEDNPLISPFHKEQLQPASYDLLLNSIAEEYKPLYYINPGEFILASTIEWVNMDDDLVGRLEGKSSWARQGLIIHTAGFIDPGFNGTLVLEITNLSDKPIMLERGMRIAQIAFHQMVGPAARPYGHKDLHSHYQNQVGIVHGR